MNARERANWFDTEGSLYVSPPGRPLKQSVAFISISQFDRLPLEDFLIGAEMDGVRCKITSRHSGSPGEYLLLITTLEDIAREIVAEAPYIRTVGKIREIEKFRDFLQRVRVRLNKGTNAARELLDSLEWPLNILRTSMTIEDRANWFDTEGNLYVTRSDSKSKTKEASMTISQAQLEPIEDFAKGALDNGVISKIYHRQRISDEYLVRIRRLDQIAKELHYELPFLRTKSKVDEVGRLKEFLELPRARVSCSLKIARDLLSSGPVV